MAAPLLFMAIPLLVAPLVYAFGRVRAAAVTMAVVLAGVLALAALRLPLGQPAAWLGGATVEATTTLLGRSFTIEPGDRLALVVVFGVAALLFLVSGASRSGGLFLPVGLAVLGLLAAALFVRPFLFAALFLELSAALATVMLVTARDGHRGRDPVTRGPLRLLVYTTLALPFILLTGWLLEASTASPEDPAFIEQATLLLMLGFAILLGIVPFHSWMPELAEHAPAFPAAFVFGIQRMGVVFLLLAFLDTYPWLNQNPAIDRALTVGGGLTALAGALITFGQSNFGRVMGYLVLVDVGAAMLGIGLGTPAGVEAAIVTVVVRGLALPLWALGLDRLRRAAGGDSFAALAGQARTHPFAAAAVVVGVLSVAGFPLTAGFAGRWALLRLLAQIHPTGAIILLLGTSSAALVCARGLAAMLQRPARAPAQAAPVAPVSRPAMALYALGFVVLLTLGLFPQWVLPAIARAASAYPVIGR